MAPHCCRHRTHLSAAARLASAAVPVAAVFFSVLFSRLGERRPNHWRVGCVANCQGRHANVIDDEREKFAGRLALFYKIVEPQKLENKHPLIPSSSQTTQNSSNQYGAHFYMFLLFTCKLAHKNRPKLFCRHFKILTHINCINSWYSSY
jgi:hypothetical protein